jgi:two-component system response regulator WspF
VRIAIVNDMPLAVEALRRVVSSVPGHSVAWVAGDGVDAIKKCAQDTPDLILMDLIMPAIDGVEATRRIMVNSPCAIIIVTATVEGNSAKVVEALGAGALDAIQTPKLSGKDGLEKPNALLIKIDAVGNLISGNEKRKRPGKFVWNRGGSGPSKIENLIVIGASAGGPSALATVLKSLPRDFPSSLVIIQHIDAQFAPSMAHWLAEQCALTVRIAREHDKPEAGTVLIAGTNDHLVFLDSHTVGYTKEPRDSHYRPSVDVFFESVVRHWEGNAIGVLLTGMGRDGAKGLKSMRDFGAFTITQDAETCVVYGMPKAAAELGAAVEILPVHRIASRLMSSLKSENRRSCA